MATASSLLSEERFLCSICLDVFTEPVSTPCGHNFCSACIRKYWDNSVACQCPFCKRTFSSRPELHVNTVMSELAAEFTKLNRMKASTPEPELPERADILCDICSDMKAKAVKSCLMCLTSFCDVHLEPHQRVSVLKSHKLIDPVSNLDDRMCKKHDKITELYCRTDQACVCVLCLKTDHKNHDVVPLEEEYEAVMATKDGVMANIQQMVQSRSDKIEEIENSLDVSQREAEKEIEASVQVFAGFIRSIQKSQAELVEVIEARHRATKQKAEGFLKELRAEVADLESRSSQLERLSRSEDHHCFLQNFSTLCSPANKDWTDTSVHSDLSFQAVREAVARVENRADGIVAKIPEIKMKRMRDHAVDLTLDPDTAHCCLLISQDRKQVALAEEQKLPNNPKRFEKYQEILAKEGFTGGKSYFEVQVNEKPKWAVGVARESVDRKGDTDLSVSDGYLAFGLESGKYFAYEDSAVVITLEEKLQKVGIFVDYDGGEVSFYDADSQSHIYSFSGYTFKEKLYPYFCPQDNENGLNSAPLIITPVSQTN
ncbi:E3 ubiquitin-protein ligase TRIM39-like [Stegastes partitus]|uniref:E3 ubiquitin-protein ligase TRIM39-like n=1 Tax=Stegastes partitus TaxID=144197 RepID=A0A3B5BG86_9TELE|nr:PREDICTED: E3 ubiquitin-protein ligase TRIM39-like [Stegastes partitus]